MRGPAGREPARLPAEAVLLAAITPICGMGQFSGGVPMAGTETKSIFDTEPDPVEEALLDAEAEAAYKAGRVVPHAKVVEWLKSWGTRDVLPRPTPQPR
jgi:hypothetical protein